YTSLRQVHLPSLDRANVVQFDKQRGTIDLDTGFDRVSAHLVYALHSAPSAETEMLADQVDPALTSPPTPDSPAAEHNVDTADQTAGVTRLRLLVGGVAVLAVLAPGARMFDNALAALEVQSGAVLVVSVASLCLATAAALFVSLLDR
ncbi:MAG: hypothetical protein J07HX5_00870, partial [halophilic archaeon J07HX5]